MKNEVKKRKPRWWPAVTVLALDLIGIVWVWSSSSFSGQDKVLNTISLQLITLLLLIIWVLFLSRIAWKVRIAAFGSVLAVFLILGSLFEIREVSGNLVPILVWRWADEPQVLEAVEASPDDDVAAVAQRDNNSMRSFHQFLGPNRNARIVGVALDTDWESHPPKQLWRQSVGGGWSSFAITDGMALTQEQHGPQEMVVCRNLLTGEVIWAHGDEERYATVVGGEGPRATPTIAGDKVVTMGGTGLLNCLDLKTGRAIWQRHVLKENETNPNPWGISWSPLVLDSLVIISTGGGEGPSLAAYHLEKGENVWFSGRDRSGYSSPMFASLAGTSQILVFNDTFITSCSPKDGAVFWKHPWPSETEAVAQPVVLPDDRILITSGYGVGSKLLEITGKGEEELVPKVLWESNRLKAKFTNVVYLDGYVYGLDDGILTCIDAKDGRRMWKRGRYGHGQILLVGDVLIVQAESGDLALVKADPEAHRELATFQALQGKTWNNPAFAPPYLLVRNGQEAACYELTLLN